MTRIEIETHYMKPYRRLLQLLSILIFCSSVAADPCGKDGMSVLRSNDDSSFLFYLFRPGPDIYFALDGKQISFPNGMSGPRRFVIDGIFFESLIVKPSEFMKVEKSVADLDMLKAHRQHEVEYIQKTPSPLKQFAELGPRRKAAEQGQPEFTFYLWQMSSADDPKGARQYFLTSVSNNEVVVLTAIVRDDAANARAMQAFQTYAASFQHVLKKEQCPEKSK